MRNSSVVLDNTMSILLATSHVLEGWGDQEALAVESSAKVCFLRPPRQLQPAYGLHCAYDLPFRPDSDRPATPASSLACTRRTSPRNDRCLSSAGNTALTAAASRAHRHECGSCASSTASFRGPCAEWAAR